MRSASQSPGEVGEKEGRVAGGASGAVNLFRPHATLDLHVTFHYRPAAAQLPSAMCYYHDRRPELQRC